MGEVYEVRRLYVHKEFNNVTLFNDIALLTLKKKILMTNYVTPICLPEGADYLQKVGITLYRTNKRIKRFKEWDCTRKQNIETF